MLLASQPSGKNKWSVYTFETLILEHLNNGVPIWGKIRFTSPVIATRADPTPEMMKSICISQNNFTLKNL